MIHKGVFILAHELGYPSFNSTYNQLMRAQWKSHEEIKQHQEKQLRHLMEFAYRNVPYYHNMFRRIDITPDSIKAVEDLNKLPILTKDIIKENWEGFKPINLSSMKYGVQSTGGSTGAPMQYRLSKQDRFLGGALLYRGWGYGGFELGDKMIFLAGSSLDVGTKTHLSSKIHEVTRNIRMLSSYDMGESELVKYSKILNTFRPKFIRGYAYSIYFFARWLKENQVSFYSPKSIFTTAEKLFPHMRKTIEEVFDCDVYDTYGLNDGGISAYECAEHTGLHIDAERGILEVIDGGGNSIDEGEGKILATSLNNYSMPFIRYDTGDEGILLNEPCPCGRGYPILKEVLGRQRDVLITPEGKYIHGGFLSRIFWEMPHVKEFQVIQKRVDLLIVNIVPEPDFDAKCFDRMRSIIASRSNGWTLEFHLVDAIDRSRAGKYKFIINEVSNV